jgi:hypothetical protein
MLLIFMVCSLPTISRPHILYTQAPPFRPCALRCLSHQVPQGGAPTLLWTAGVGCARSRKPGKQRMKY